MQATLTKTIEILGHKGDVTVVQVGQESVIVRDLLTHYSVTGNGDYVVRAVRGVVASKL